MKPSYQGGKSPVRDTDMKTKIYNMHDRCPNRGTYSMQKHHGRWMVSSMEMVGED